LRPLLVTAAIIEHDDSVLIAQRLGDSRFGPNQWEFPGGKVEFGEKPKDTLRREIAEELDLSIEVNDLISLTSHVYSDQNGELHVVLASYLCTVKSGKPEPEQCQDAKWVPSKRAELMEIDWCEADIEIVNRYIEKISQ
jgi:8-oxo-dGTP diphosphatase